VSYPSNQIDALLEQPEAFKSEYLLNEKYCSVQCFEAGVPEEGGGAATPQSSKNDRFSTITHDSPALQATRVEARLGLLRSYTAGFLLRNSPFYTILGH